MGSAIIQPSSSVTGAQTLKGDLDCSTNPNYPSAVVGDTYVVTVAGKVGGASGTTVEVGDQVVCKTTNAGGTQASVGTSWFVVQGNVAFSSVGLAVATAASEAAARTALGIDFANVTITGGTISGITQFGVSMANNTAMTGFALGTITDTTSRPLNITQTWNNAGLTATLIKASAVVTSANSASKLLELFGGAAGTTSAFAIASNGAITVGANYLAMGPSGAVVRITGDGTGTYYSINGHDVFRSNMISAGTGIFAFPANLKVGWSNVTGSSLYSTATPDAFFGRKAAGAIYIGEPLASAWINQSVEAAGAIVGTTTNGSPTNTLTITGSVSTGTGTGGNIIFGVYGTNGVSGTAIGTLNTVLTIVAARKVLNISNIPTSSAGLSAGDVYSNAGVLTIV